LNSVFDDLELLDASYSLLFVGSALRHFSHDPGILASNPVLLLVGEYADVQVVALH
jgi:hypothetical protein